MLDIRRIVAEEISIAFGNDWDLTLETYLREVVREEVIKLVKSQLRGKMIESIDPNTVAAIVRRIRNAE